MRTLAESLSAAGITLPAVPGPFGAYVPARRVGDVVYTAGQLPMRDGQLVATGQVKPGDDLEPARSAARQCVINALAAVATLPGGIDQLGGVIRVGVFVSSDPAFTEQPKVANAASELLQELFGDAGRHVRAAVGVASLPLGAAVEIEIMFACSGEAGEGSVGGSVES